MNMIDVFQNFSFPVAFLIITIYAIKLLYDDIIEANKSHENMLLDKLELITKTNVELSETNRVLVDKINISLDKLNGEVSKTNKLIIEVINNNK